MQYPPKNILLTTLRIDPQEMNSSKPQQAQSEGMGMGRECQLFENEKRMSPKMKH